MAGVKLIFGSICLGVAFSVIAETTISQVLVNQRWPWYEKVDVDFVLAGDKSDVDVTATWDGHQEPYRLGCLFDCTNGQNRLTWDPSTSEFAGQTLTGFNVTVTSASTNDHKYLVVDLVNGGYSFLPDVPEGGWTDEYKSSKMAFRRIPAGTYILGEPKDTFTYLGLADSSAEIYANRWNRRTVTFTSDFYVAIFIYTEAQHECLTTGTVGESHKVKEISYYSLRGSTNVTDGVDWPTTGYKVATNSVLGILRAKCGLVVDLCQEEQWEVAARAGTTTILPNGVTTADSLTTLTNKLNEICSWYYGSNNAGEKSVGRFAPNEWGLYDVVGLAGEWTLDKAINRNKLPKYGLATTSTNPVGGESSAYAPYRVFRSGGSNYSSVNVSSMMSFSRMMLDPSVKACATRFCIHLKPLGNLNFPESE